MEFDDLPEGWRACPFIEAADRVTTRGFKIKASDYKDSGMFPVIDQGQTLAAGFTDEADRVFRGQLPVIVFGDHTRNVKFVDFKFVIGADGVVVLRSKSFIDPKFFYYWLTSRNLHNLGYSRHFKLLSEQVVMFPDALAEQRRIVARVEALTRRLDQARQAALAEGETFFESALKSAFDELNEDESCEVQPFDEAVERVQPHIKLKTAEYKETGELPIVDQGQKLICGYTDDTTRRFQGPLPVVVFGDHTRNVKHIFRGEL